MNKKILTLVTAITACSVSTAYAVDIRLFGHVHADIQVNAPDSHSTVNNNGSTLGFKVSADFSGFKAYFKHVFLVDGLDGDSLLSENDASYFHLYGGDFFGSLRFGHQLTSAGVAYNFVGNNHLPDSTADFGNIGFAEYKTTKTLVYQLPAYSGFTLAIGASANANGDGTNKLLSSPSIGLMYDEGHGLKLGFGYEIIDDRALGDIVQSLNGTDAENLSIDNPPSSDSKMLQLGGSYTFDNITVGAQFEQTKNLLLAESGIPSFYGIIPQDGVDRTSFGVSGKMAFGHNSALSVNLGTEKVKKLMDEANNHFISIALNHTINERVNTYIAFRNKNTDMANMQKIIGDDQQQMINSLIDQRAVAIGMQYQF